MLERGSSTTKTGLAVPTREYQTDPPSPIALALTDHGFGRSRHSTAENQNLTGQYIPALRANGTQHPTRPATDSDERPDGDKQRITASTARYTH